MIVLENFNRTKILNFQQLSTLTSLPELNQILKALVKTKVLSIRPKLTPEQHDITPKHEFCLNGKFEHKMIRVNVNIKLGQEQKAATSETQKQIEDGRLLEIQACIVRVMKTRKELDHLNLVTETIDHLKSRFNANVGSIKRCIEILIEKEYL